MPRLLPVILFAAVALSGGANAQTNVSIQEMLSACADGLLVADTSRDGWITPAEAEAAMEANFSLLDGDGDGAVTQDEFAACRTGSMTETRRSATLYASNVFFIADEDDDDVLDRDTWLAQAMVQMGKVPFHDEGANPVSYDAVMQGFSLPSAELDRNGDGLIQRLEAGAGVVPGFERSDVNGDGHVTATEHATHDVTAEVIEPSTDDIQAELRAIWTAMNSDGGAVVTLEEYSAAGRARYEQAAEAALSDPEVGVPVEALH